MAQKLFRYRGQYTTKGQWVEGLTWGEVLELDAKETATTEQNKMAPAIEQDVSSYRNASGQQQQEIAPQEQQQTGRVPKATKSNWSDAITSGFDDISASKEDTSELDAVLGNIPAPEQRRTGVAASLNEDSYEAPTQPTGAYKGMLKGLPQEMVDDLLLTYEREKLADPAKAANKLASEIQKARTTMAKLKNLEDEEGIKSKYAIKTATPGYESAENIATGVQEGANERAKFEQGQANYRARVAASAKTTTDPSQGSGLSDADNLAAYSLATEIAGKRPGSIKMVYPTIINRLKAGESINDIRDSLRYSQQSEDMVGNARLAIQQIYSGKVPPQTYDSFDDVLATGDNTKVFDFLKQTARKNADASYRTQIMGEERTIGFLSEIQNELSEFEKKGGNTNIFTGTTEQIAKKIGTVNNAELRGIATKIKTALMRYRKAMTGLAFTGAETSEYTEIFPSISKTSKFNTATTSALLSAFEGDIDYFYSNMMGEDIYGSFKSGGGFGETTQPQEEIVTLPSNDVEADALYESLPSGAEYIDPTGRKRKKP